VYSTDDGGDLRRALKDIKLDSENVGAPEPTQPSSSKPKGPRIRVWLDTKKRRGKAVTIAGEFAHNPQTIAEIARRLKTLCGAGGTVEGREVVIQGDHRDKITEHLTREGYRVDVKK
jgi:translation initiation factor 1